MTSPKTLAGLPRAGAFSKLHDYKQNVQKMKGLLKNWVLTENQCEDFRQKVSKTPLLPRKTKQKNLRKAFRIKLFELCKARSKKWNPYLLTFYVVSGGHEIAKDAGRATTYRRNFKAPWLQTERTKNEGSSEKLSFNAETVWNFQTNESRNSSHRMKTKTKEPQAPEGKNWTWTVSPGRN